MKIKSIKHSSEEMPKQVTVSMSIQEFLYLAKVTGAKNHSEADEVIKNGHVYNSSIYDCASRLFIQYFEDGIDDAIKELL
jgi:hypothetical protein